LAGSFTKIARSSWFICPLPDPSRKIKFWRIRLRHNPEGKIKYDIFKQLGQDRIVLSIHRCSLRQCKREHKLNLESVILVWTNSKKDVVPSSVKSRVMKSIHYVKSKVMYLWKWFHSLFHNREVNISIGPQWLKIFLCREDRQVDL